ncbi:MAG: hypothetical protein PHN79_08855, partial [Methanoregula sp.]|nr:hypothetical protein [Methanoregula sp.]
ITSNGSPDCMAVSVFFRRGIESPVYVMFLCHSYESIPVRGESLTRTSYTTYPCVGEYDHTTRSVITSPPNTRITSQCPPPARRARKTDRPAGTTELKKTIGARTHGSSHAYLPLPAKPLVPFMRLLDCHDIKNVDNASRDNIKKCGIRMCDMHPTMTVRQ